MKKKMKRIVSLWSIMLLLSTSMISEIPVCFAGGITPTISGAQFVSGGGVNLDYRYPAVYMELQVIYTWDKNNINSQGASYIDWYRSDAPTKITVAGAVYTKAFTSTYSGLVDSSGKPLQKYTPVPDDYGKYIQCIVTPVDNQGNIGAPIYIDTTVGPINWGPVSRIGTPLTGWVENTPADNVFKIEGSTKEFILLDTTNNDNSKFFVMAKDPYGIKEFDKDNFPMFDSSDGGIATGGKNRYGGVSNNENIAYWLNHDFKTQGNVVNGVTYILPPQILANIDNNHVWTTEGGLISNSDYRKDITDQCGIALLSQLEFREYIGKFGNLDSMGVGNSGGSSNGWWLRTMRGVNGTGATVLRVSVDSANKGQTWTWDANQQSPIAIRPVFYLDRDFFSTVRLDVPTIGKNVIDTVAKTYSVAELAGVYTADEITNKFKMKTNFETVSCEFSKIGGGSLNNTLQNTDSIEVNATIQNNCGENSTIVLILAIYDENDTCLQCGIKQGSILASDKQISIKKGFTIPSTAKPKYAKVYYWDSLKGMHMLDLADSFPR